MFTEGQQSVLAVTTVVYFLLLLGVSVWIGTRQIRTYDDYNVASRNVSLFPLILTYVGTAIGGSLLLGIMTNGYVSGMGQQWFNIAILVVSVLMAVFVMKRVRQMGERHHYVTIGDFSAHRFGTAATGPGVVGRHGNAVFEGQHAVPVPVEEERILRFEHRTAGETTLQCGRQRCRGVADDAGANEFAVRCCHGVSGMTALRNRSATRSDSPVRTSRAAAAS